MTLIKKLKVTGTHQIRTYVLFVSTPTIFILPATFGRREKNEPVQPIILEERLKFERKKKTEEGEKIEMLHCIETAQKSDHRRPFAVSLNATT